MRTLNGLSTTPQGAVERRRSLVTWLLPACIAALTLVALWMPATSSATAGFEYEYTPPNAAGVCSLSFDVDTTELLDLNNLAMLLFDPTAAEAQLAQIVGDVGPCLGADARDLVMKKIALVEELYLEHLGGLNQGELFNKFITIYTALESLKGITASMTITATPKSDGTKDIEIASTINFNSSRIRNFEDLFDTVIDLINEKLKESAVVPTSLTPLTPTLPSAPPPIPAATPQLTQLVSAARVGSCKRTRGVKLKLRGATVGDVVSLSVKLPGKRAKQISAQSLRNGTLMRTSRSRGVAKLVATLKNGSIVSGRVNLRASCS